MTGGNKGKLIVNFNTAQTALKPQILFSQNNYGDTQVMTIARPLNVLFLNILFVLLASMSPAHSAQHENNAAPQLQSENGKLVTPTKYVNSDEKAYAAMQELPVDEPLYMLNMIRYNDLAKYDEGSEFASKGWSGSQAYAEYTRHSSPIAQRTGGNVVYAGKPQLTLIGPEYEQWDAIFIVSYPNLNSFLALITHPDYKKHAFHRSAAVADSRLIRMTSLESNIPEVALEGVSKKEEKN